MQSPIEQIKNKLGIVDVISWYLPLVESGNQWKGLCPFHQEKTPSFFVTPERGGYYCFGCGEKGDIFSFVQKFEGLDFYGSLTFLASRAGIKLSKNDISSDPINRLYEIMSVSTFFFQQELKKNIDAKKYLEKRGINPKSVEVFSLGYAPLSWSSLFNFLNQKGFSIDDMEKAGLVKKGDKGFYDRFRGRVMFPISDSSGRVIAFSGRILVPDEKSAKYLNSPDTPLFDKSSVLFGLDKAKFLIKKHDFSILVEGQMDLVLSHQNGFGNTVALSGTALSEKLETENSIRTHLGVIRALSKNIIIAFDSDEAGIRASRKSAIIALSLGMDVKIAKLPDGLDPADVLLGMGVSAWKEIVSKSMPVILFELESVISQSKINKSIAPLVREKVLPFVLAIKHSMDRAHFIKKISTETGLREDSIWDDLKSLEKENLIDQKIIKNTESKMSTDDINKKRKIEDAVGLYVWQKEKKDSVCDISSIEKKLIEILGEDNFKREVSFINENREVLIRVERFFENPEKVKKGAEEFLLNLEEILLKERQRELSFELVRDNQETDASKVREYQHLTQRISEIQKERNKGDD